MSLKELFSNKDLKGKQQTEELCKMILASELSVDDIIAFASASKDTVKATCIEALEFASKERPALVTPACFGFVSESLKEKAPRVKWESAKVIGNTAHLYPGELDKAITNLLVNSEHTGTVVRWSAAFALGEILKLKTAYNKQLIPAVEAILKREEKNSIKKIYQAALKKTGIKF